MTMDIARLRAETPACEKIIHFNNAGAALMPEPVYNALTGHLALERDIGGYEAERRAAPAIARFYDAFAELLGAEAGEIAYVENATRAWDMAFYALALKAGDRIITHDSEYVSNYLAFLHLARRRGVEIDVAPSDASGQIDVARLPDLIGPRSRLIALTHVPTQGGLVNPVEEVGRVARAHGLTYLLDACQSVGQIDVDVARIGCHILSGTGRKFLRGPRGTGFLYVSNAIVGELDPPFIDMRAANWTTPQDYELAPGARRFENWESYVGGRVGLAVAVDYALALGIANIEARVAALAARLRSRLTAVSGVTVRDLGERKCAIVTFDKAGVAAHDVAHRLAARAINVSVSENSSARLDFGRRELTAVVRASLHYYNTEAEIETFCEAVADI